jgi:Ca2+-transporting ATPase
MSETQWYSNDVSHVFKELETSEDGLSSQEAERRLEQYGPNELVETGGISPLRMFLEQFTDPMVIILLVAIIISVVSSTIEEGALIDAIVIAAIVIFNAIFGFVQEYKSEQALAALKEMAAPTARVKRNGLWKDIDSREVVPGDILGFEPGDRVPADGRVTFAVGLSADEAVLTGESIAVRKIDETINLDNPSVGDMKNMVFSGTTITAGKGLGVVTATGMKTRFGQIAELVQESEKEMTPLQIDLDDLGKKLGMLIIVMCIIVFGAELIELGTSDWVEELLAAIALAVSAIPEGLPAVVTITLAIGVQRMVDENAIVRRLPSVETLGSTTIICSDKTGTITKNEMTVRKLFVNGMTIDVTGVGYKKDGQFYRASEQINPLNDEHVTLLFKIGQLCSNAILQEDPTGKADWSIVGDPTEGALLVVAEKAGLPYSETSEKFREIHEISFDSARKRMTSIYEDETKNILAYSKGAPEVLIPLCSHIFENGEIRPLTEADRQNILEINSGFAENALRILAFAFRDIDDVVRDWDPKMVEHNMVFVGLMGMIDPPRDEVVEAVAKCRRAGIRPIMITGDHKLTAKAISVDVGLIDRDGEVITGVDIEDMTDEGFFDCVASCNVFARVNPEHKLRIVTALREQNQVVAMTGDGVNDAPAIKSSDVGIAMGIRGSDVTKEAADVTLTDDNFATIVTAVEKGREIYANIKKFIRFLLAANFDELFLVFTVIMLGLPLPITPIQILWLNLATDGFPALALGVDPPEEGVMNRPPRKPGKKMMDRGMVSFIIISGFIAFLSSFLIFLISLHLYADWIPGITGPRLEDVGLSWNDPDWALALKHARTAVFADVVAFELVFVWNCRDEYRWVWQTSLRGSKALISAVLLSIVLTLATIYVPVLQGLFGTYSLGFDTWALVILTSLPVLLIPPHWIFGHKGELKEWRALQKSERPEVVAEMVSE